MRDWAMASARRILEERLRAAFDRRGARRRSRAAGLRPRRLPGQWRAGPGQAARSASSGGGRAGRRRGRPRRGLLERRGERARVRQPHPGAGFPGRPRRRDRSRIPASGSSRAPRGGWSSTTRRPTWPRRCTSATCAPRSSATRSAGCSSFVGHDVGRENHIGDWGTPFGMLIEHLVDLGEEEAAQELSIGDLDGFYQEARASSSTPTRRFASAAAAGSSCSRAGTPETLRLWRVLVGGERPLLRRRLRAPRGAPHRRRRGGRELLQRHAARGGRRARRQGPAGRERRRPVRLPAGLHQPRRRAAAAHRAEVRRRLRLRRHRPGRHPRPGSTGSAPR